MNRFPKIFLPMIFAVATMGLSSASDIYVAQNNAGVGTGANCANARSAVWFNGAENWGAGSTQIGPGTTVHLCGAITGTGGATALTFQGNGTSGNPITFLWESGAALTAPYWNTTNGAINLTGRSWIVLDGNGPAGTNGIIQCTANGTALANRQESQMVQITNTSHITIKNLWFKDNYVRVANTSGSTGFDAEDIVGIDATDITVAFNKFTNGRAALGVAFTQNGQNYEFNNNYTFAIEVPTVLATVSPNATWTSALVHDNHFAGGVDQWDSPENAFHHDGGFHFFAQASGAHINGFRFYNNLIDGVWGNDAAYFASTGGTHITAYAYPEETGGDTTIFNNVFDTSAGDPRYTAADNGSIFCKVANSPGATCNIYNNTFKGKAGNTTYNIILGTDGASGIVNFKNNVVQNQGGPVYLGGAGNTSITSRSNAYYQMGPDNFNGNSFASWQASGQDPLPSTNGVDPKLNSDGTLQSGSSVMGVGTNLTSLSIAALNSDKAGVARPSSGAWAVGAYQGSGGASTNPPPSTSPPSPPTSLTGIVN